MTVISFSKARETLKATMDKLCKDHKPVIVTRQNQESVVMISLEDYKAMEETLYLIRSPKNAKRLLESIQQYHKGEFSEQKLIDED